MQLEQCYRVCADGHHLDKIADTAMTDHLSDTEWFIYVGAVDRLLSDFVIEILHEWKCAKRQMPKIHYARIDSTWFFLISVARADDEFFNERIYSSAWIDIAGDPHPHLTGENVCMLEHVLPPFLLSDERKLILNPLMN